MTWDSPSRPSVLIMEFSRAFKDNLCLFHQEHHLSGVGAKHQNGIAERNIKTISYLTRAMFVHAALKWPSTYNLDLWPFAMNHAVFIFNHLPSRDNLSPEEKWTSTLSASHHLLCRLKPWRYVPHMSLILPSKMERKFQSGNLAVAKGNFLASPHLTLHQLA